MMWSACPGFRPNYLLPPLCRAGSGKNAGAVGSLGGLQRQVWDKHFWGVEPGCEHKKRPGPTRVEYNTPRALSVRCDLWV